MARCSKRSVADGGGWVGAETASDLGAGIGPAAAERGSAANSRPQSRVHQVQ